MSHPHLLAVAFTLDLAAGLLVGMVGLADAVAATEGIRQPPVQASEIYLPFAGRTSDARSGWAIGDDPSGTAVILHTADSGAHWAAQGDRSQWQDRRGTDISAVDEKTAWVAMTGVTADSPGLILHTTDGGTTWFTQTLPAAVDLALKSIKGLSPRAAWATTLDGVILHTTDGGSTWEVVPHPSVTITQVNRIDAIGANIWVADVLAGDRGIVHSRDNGQTWHAEVLPDAAGNNGPLALNAFSPSVVWAAANGQLDFYRTLDGGLTWQKRIGGSVPDNDLDDLCAGSEDLVWGVYNLGGSSGRIYRVQTHPGSDPIWEVFTPLPGYTYEGITCLDGSTAWVAGYRGNSIGADKPRAIILATVDGGAHWTSQPLNETDFQPGKISFAGARR
ncbi:MAG: YCF48-related protein [Caldilineaceae bacterium]